jgi:hypothetical protein
MESYTSQEIWAESIYTTGRGAIRLTCTMLDEYEADFFVSQVRWGAIAIGEKGFLPG